MKTLIIAVIVTLFLGAGTGWYFGQRYEKKNIQDQLQQVKTILVKYYAEGSNSVQVIDCIESGEKERAVELLAESVGRCYHWYYRIEKNHARELIAQIELLADKYPAISNTVSKAKAATKIRYE